MRRAQSSCARCYCSLSVVAQLLPHHKNGLLHLCAGTIQLLDLVFLGPHLGLQRLNLAPRLLDCHPLVAKLSVQKRYRFATQVKGQGGEGGWGSLCKRVTRPSWQTRQPCWGGAFAERRGSLLLTMAQPPCVPSRSCGVSLQGFCGGWGWARITKKDQRL
jgi:hypothetical protein